ncbi:MAG: AAA family ATPase [Verrucomicrobiales bacterium]
MATIVPSPPLVLPPWARHIVESYNSHTYNQFVLTGNVHDLYESDSPHHLATLPEFIQAQIIPRFDVIIAYDIGNGIQVLKGREIFGRWHEKVEVGTKHPRAAIEVITLYLRYVANLAKLGQTRTRVAVILVDAALVIPDESRSSEVNATAFLIREWSREPLLLEHDITTFILAENHAELHFLIRQNQHAAHLAVPHPGAGQIRAVLSQLQSRYPIALGEIGASLADASRQWSGATIRQMLNLLKLKEHQKTALKQTDLAQQQAALIEKDCAGLIEFLKPSGNLDQLHGQTSLVAHLRQNIELWRKGETSLIPMGYLISGPVGTGKTFLVKRLAGEADVPVLVLKNFRDKWYGSTEGNLEKIFRTLRALDRCYVFIDEADQTLGKRDSSGSEPGVSGRIYSMLAQEMSNKENRGKIVWILASSRPDLIEVDLKRPGRIDLKIPIFPTSTPEEGFQLLRALAKQHGFELPEELLPLVYNFIPDLLTPGEADALITDLKREALTTGGDIPSILSKRLWNYLRPIPLETIQHQIQLAMQECSRAEFIPDRFRKEFL